MKPLKGYKNVTDNLITRPCAWEGCPKYGAYSIARIGESIYDKPLYCREHVVLAAHKREEEDGRRTS